MILYSLYNATQYDFLEPNNKLFEPSNSHHILVILFKRLWCVYTLHDTVPCSHGCSTSHIEK